MKVQRRVQALLFMLLFSVVGFAQKKTFHLEDLNRLTSISSLSISPDGELAIFMTSNRNHYCPVKKMIWDKSDIEQAQGLFFFPTQEFIQVVLNKES